MDTTKPRPTRLDRLRSRARGLRALYELTGSPVARAAAVRVTRRVYLAAVSSLDPELLAAGRRAS